MPSGVPNYDASPSALGYIYQCRLGLLLALRKNDDPSLAISIEKIDDVAFEQHGTAFERLQLKHQVIPGTLTDSSQGLWKTIRIWSDDTHSGKLQPEKTLLYLWSTGYAPAESALAYLRNDHERKAERARTLLESVAGESKDRIIQTALTAYRRLTLAQKKSLFDAIHVFDKTPTVADLRPLINFELRLSTEEKYRNALADRLEGWWFDQVITHLSSKANAPIAVRRVMSQVHEISRQFQRDRLPDDFLEAEIPADKCPANDVRRFIKQLELIGISTARIRAAQEDFYRASAQRSRWVDENLIDLKELSSFELRLHRAWKTMFDIMLETVEGCCVDEDLRRHGVELYNWAQTHAPTNSTLWVRREFDASYMTTGSFHILADKDPPRVGWHPHHISKLGDSANRSRGMNDA